MSDKHPAEIAKWEAEARAAHALADFHIANVLKLAADQAKAEADAREATLRGEIVAIELDRHRQTRALELTNSYLHHTYNFLGAVNAASVQALMNQLDTWDRLDGACQVEIVFNSPGGSVVDGLALWDAIAAFRTKGHHVTTVALGMAASMAGILLQAGDKRVIGRESWLMIHETSFGVHGKFGEVEDFTKWVEKIQDRVLDIFASRSTLTKKQIKNRWARTDWWIASEEAVELGFADEVR